MKKLGIDNLALLVIFGLTLTKNTLAALKDGFQPAKDLMDLFPTLMQIPNVYTHAAEAVAEFKDLDPTEEEQMNEKVKAALPGIPNEKVKFFTEHGLELGFHSMVLVNEFKALEEVGTASTSNS